MKRFREARELVQVFAAACTGLQLVAGEMGRPLILIDAAPDAETAVERLNECAYGSVRRAPGSTRWLKHEEGWADWNIFPLSSVTTSIRTDPFGITVKDDVILVPSPAGVPLQEFRAALRGSLRHLRLHDVTLEATFLADRSSGSGRFPQPRYTSSASGNARDVALAIDIYMLDPADAFWRLYWAVVASRAAVTEGVGPPLWR